MQIAGVGSTSVRSLIEHGKPPATPSAAVRWATTPRQRTIEAPLGDLPAAIRVLELAQSFVESQEVESQPD